MPSFKPRELWEVAPHTLAKIEIVRQYLVRWFQILGRGHSGRRLLYIDGFAGPGEYTNSRNSSPLASLAAAENAIRPARTFATRSSSSCSWRRNRGVQSTYARWWNRGTGQRPLSWEILQGTFDNQVGRILQEIRVASARVYDGDSACAVVFAPDYGSKDINEIGSHICSRCGASAASPGSLAPAA